jgi:hypothetical protein
MEENLISTTINLELVPEQSVDEAFASISLNPKFKWAKFILTDDLPNGNKQRIPAEEFDNIINSGVLAPIKMAEGGINDGHEGAKPIGVISHLKKVGNKIIGLAALWEKERPEDVAAIKAKADKNEPLNLSWEISYADAQVNEEGISDLHGVVLTSTTLVGIPAYAGRTPIYAVASQNNDGTEDKNVEELEKVQKELEEVKASLLQKEEELKALKTEKDTLAAFKEETEKAKADEVKYASIQEKFSKAGIKKEAKYFEDNKEFLMKLEEASLDFMLQEMVGFASMTNPASNDSTAGQVPNFMNEQNGKATPVQLAKALSELRNKK